MDTSADREELEWIQRASHGDHEAFRYLVLSYESHLLAYLFRLLGDWENARDVAQETFVAAFFALSRWKPMRQSDNSDTGQREENILSSEHNKEETHPLAPWLYRIATNRALTLLKKQAAHTSLARPTRGGQLQDEHDIPLMDQREQAMMMEDRYVARELLSEALRHLSQEDATCLVLRFVGGEQYSDIAVRVGLTKEAVRKRISRGLIALRAAYKALDMEELV
jgi:RNA polymerase sigma-70 factor (ECF subfamily)